MNRLHRRFSYSSLLSLAAIVVTSAVACGQITSSEPGTKGQADAGPEAGGCDQGDQQVIAPTTGSCYMLFTSLSATWQAARDQCIGLGSHLAEITTRDEHDLLVRLAGTDTDVWVGGNDLVSENAWFWVTGELVSDFGWGVDEPNNGASGEAENCMIIRNLGPDNIGTWDDRSCAMQYGYICERD